MLLHFDTLISKLLSTLL